LVVWFLATLKIPFCLKFSIRNLWFIIRRWLDILLSVLGLRFCGRSLLSFGLGLGSIGFRPSIGIELGLSIRFFLGLLLSICLGFSCSAGVSVSSKFGVSVGLSFGVSVGLSFCVGVSL